MIIKTVVADREYNPELKMKKQTIYVGSLSLGTGLALVPQGLYVNKRMDKIEQDALLTFVDTWRKVNVVYVSKCRLDLNTSIGAFIIRYAFGEDASIETLTEVWDEVCESEGYGVDAYTTDNVWLIDTREYIKEEYEAEMREKEKELKKRAEKERLLDLARKGVYEHKDILQQ